MQSENAMDPERYKAVLARVPTAVTVVTVGDGANRHGATVGTFASLSLDPPLVMFAMKRDSRLVSRLEVGSAFGVNVLAANQAEVARDFASPQVDRFGRIRWCEEHELPRVDDAVAWITAAVRERVPLGDHLLIVGTVGHLEAGDAAPLVYLDRAFAKAEPVEATR